MHFAIFWGGKLVSFAPHSQTRSTQGTHVFLRFEPDDDGLLSQNTTHQEFGGTTFVKCTSK